MALADDLIVELGAVAGVLGWTNATPQITRAISKATAKANGDADGLIVIAEYYAWQYASNDLATKYDFSAETADYKRSQMFANVKAALARAQSEAALYLGGSAFGQMLMEDPYAEADSGAEFG